ncbi:hypothetical protein LCGC14_2547060 [marine sediment metagenome]|uniref:Uncharacterized protein n=1 Tax=marine sediment metagenome TaxID=412755 RepID=A0A0F9AP09_9ZZZZ
MAFFPIDIVLRCSECGLHLSAKDMQGYEGLLLDVEPCKHECKPEGDFVVCNSSPSCPACRRRESEKGDN